MNMLMGNMSDYIRSLHLTSSAIWQTHAWHVSGGKGKTTDAIQPHHPSSISLGGYVTKKSAPKENKLLQCFKPMATDWHL